MFFPLLTIGGELIIGQISKKIREQLRMLFLFQYNIEPSYEVKTI